MVQYEAKGIGAADEGLQTILHEQYNQVFFFFLFILIKIISEYVISRRRKTCFVSFEASHGRKG